MSLFDCISLHLINCKNQMHALSTFLCFPPFSFFIPYLVVFYHLSLLPPFSPPHQMPSKPPPPKRGKRKALNFNEAEIRNKSRGSETMHVMLSIEMLTMFALSFFQRDSLLCIHFYNVGHAFASSTDHELMEYIGIMFCWFSSCLIDKIFVAIKLFAKSI